MSYRQRLGRPVRVIQDQRVFYEDMYPFETRNLFNYLTWEHTLFAQSHRHHNGLLTYAVAMMGKMNECLNPSCYRALKGRPWD